MNEVLQEAIEIIKLVSDDKHAEVKIRLRANIFLKRNKELLKGFENE